jgi:hypothetical protein
MAPFWKFRLVLFALLLSLACATTQEPKIPPKRLLSPIFSFQNITPGNIPSSDSFPEANAIYLLREAKYSIQSTPMEVGTTYFSLRMNIPWSAFSEHVIIKVLRPGGKKYGNVKIPLLGKCEVVELQARTIKPNGEIIPVDSKEIFEVNDYPDYMLYSENKSKVFTFPSVDTGSILEYYYTIGYDHMYIPRWSFQEAEPVWMSRFSYDVPNNLGYNYIYSNLPGYQIEKDIRDYEQRNCALFTVRNLPPFLNEPFSSPTPDRSCWIMMTWTSMNLWDQKISSGAETWFSIGKSYSSPFDSLTKPNEVIRKKATEITEGCRSDHEKITAIYRFIQSKFRYVAIDIEAHRIFPNQPEIVLKNLYGDCKDLVGLMKSLLEACNIKSYPVLIRTKEAGAFFEEFPTPNQFDHVMIAIPLSYFTDASHLKNAVVVGDNNLIYNKDVLIVDPTSPVHPLGRLPADVEGRPAVFCAGVDSRRILLPSHNFLDNTISTLITIETQGDDYYGTAKLRFSGEEAAVLRYLLETLSKEATRKYLQNYLTEFSLVSDLDTFNITNRTQNDSTLTIEIKIRKPMAVIRGNDQLILPIPLYAPMAMTELRNQTTRINHIYFQYPFMHQDIVKISRPPGTKISKLPESQNYVYPWGEYRINSFVSGDTIIIQRAYSIKERTINKEQFQEAKEFATRIVETSSNPILLTNSKKGN